MWFRFASFVLLLLAGAGAGWWWRGWPAACAGMLVAGLCWWSLDVLRALRILRSLRDGQLDSLPRMHGLWGEFADRLRRLQRTEQRRLDASALRLQEFLEAIQASSNG